MICYIIILSVVAQGRNVSDVFWKLGIPSSKKFNKLRSVHITAQPFQFSINGKLVRVFIM